MLNTIRDRLVAMARTSAFDVHSVLYVKKDTPGRSRTCNLWLRRPLLYPVELRVRKPLILEV